MPKILITGGTTFVSKFVASYFVDKNYDVYVLNRNSRKQIDGVSLINCDRLNIGSKLKNIHFDAVLDITAYNKEHISALTDALDSFDDYIFISSSAVYPETNPQPFCEEQSCGKNSIWGSYGTDKLEAENFLLNKVPNAYILRPPYFYGIYENLYRETFIFDCILQNRKFYIPKNGEMKLQFFNVADLCRFIEILLNRHPKQQIYNVGNPQPVTIKEWIEICCKAAGKVPDFVYVDRKFNQRDYFCFYDYEYILDVSKQTKLMPEITALDEGLKAEFEWYKHNTDCVYNRKPYFDFIDNNLKEKMG